MQKKPPCFVCETDAHGFYEAAITLLRATGHRITKPREILLDVLSKLEEPKTPTDLFEMVSTHRIVERQAAISETTPISETSHSSQTNSSLTPKSPSTTTDQETPDKITIDKVTVYRMLQAFESLGIVHQTRQNEYFKCSLAASHTIKADHTSHEQEHYHIVMKCQRCNATSVTRPPTDLIDSLKKFLQGADFALTSNVIEVSGMCAACRLKP
jgi:Fe2+ or Zn2+ uptake regulation protein